MEWSGFEGGSEHRSAGFQQLTGVERSGAEWSIGTSERRVAAAEHHQAELIQLNIKAHVG